jgi:osmotically-inducible protein OsmY
VNDLAVVAGARATSDDDRSIGERLDDEALQAKIRLAFTLHRELREARIDVVVRRRRVVLSGDVESASQKQRALQVAADVPDVNGVADGLRVGSQSH